MLSKVKNCLRTVIKNTKTFLTKDISKQLKILSDENEFLIKTSFGQDHWLTKARDMHKDERCFLLGCGPSLNKVDLSRLKKEHTMGVNGTYMIKSLNLEYFITVSHIWWKHHIDELKKFRCKRRFLPPYIDGIDSNCPTSWLRIIEPKNHVRVEKSTPWFFSTCVDHYVVLGGTVIFVALQILYHLGFSEVILLGIDHDYGLKKKDKKQGGVVIPVQKLKGHHFTRNYYPLGGNAHVDLVGIERGYKLAYEVFKNDGRKILNASPGTRLDIFPKVDYDSLFKNEK